MQIHTAKVPACCCIAIALDRNIVAPDHAPSSSISFAFRCCYRWLLRSCRKRSRKQAPARSERVGRALVRDGRRDLLSSGLASGTRTAMRSARSSSPRVGVGARSRTTAGCAVTIRSMPSPWPNRSSAARRISITASQLGLRYNFVQPGSRFQPYVSGGVGTRLDRQPRRRLRRAGTGFYLQYPERDRRFLQSERARESDRRSACTNTFRTAGKPIPIQV